MDTTFYFSRSVPYRILYTYAEKKISSTPRLLFSMKKRPSTLLLCRYYQSPPLLSPPCGHPSTRSFHPPCQRRGWHHVLERGCPSAHPRECRREVRADGQRRRIYRAINAANLSLLPASFARVIVSFVRVSVQYVILLFPA